MRYVAKGLPNRGGGSIIWGQKPTFKWIEIILTFLLQDIEYSVWISFVELYNESLFDLLEPPSQDG